MKKLSLALLVALAPGSVCLAQNQPKISLPPGTLVFDATPIIEKKDGATITVTADKPECDGVNAIKLRISLTNTGDKPFTILSDVPEKFFYIEVIDPDGKKVTQKAPRAASLRDTFSVPDAWDVTPKKSMQSTVWLTSLFDMSQVGSYTVTAQTFFRLGANGKQYIPVKSAPITVKVKSNPPISEWQGLTP